MSRLVDRGPHTVRVFPLVDVETEMGYIAQEGDGVLVEHVRVSPTTSAVAMTSTGLRQEATGFRISGSGEWPGNDGARIEIVNGPAAYVGKSVFQYGEVRHWGTSSRTDHYVVTANGERDNG